MENVTSETTKRKAKKRIDDTVEAVEEVGEEVSVSLQQRFEHARDIVEDIKQKAEVTMREHPYAVPLAAGAVGVGVGVLLSSKITRYIALTAAGTLLSEAFGPQLKEYGQKIVSSMKDQIGEKLEEMADANAEE